MLPNTACKRHGARHDFSLPVRRGPTPLKLVRWALSKTLHSKLLADVRPPVRSMKRSLLERTNMLLR
jgi:hypothetical protein